jgi:ATP-dependent protease ClpP protease subunit
VNAIKQYRAQRVKALAEGSAEPVAFYWDDPELTTVDNGGGFEIYFNDMIDDWFGISSAMIVEALQAAGGKDVLVHVNSPGGMVFEGLAIHSAFKQYSGRVTMRVEGLAASAASFVILGGDEVLIEPGAMIMIHDAWDITIGDAAEHRKTADILDKVSDSIATMYAEKAGTSKDTWRAAMIEESWYSGEEAVTAGLADSVVTSAGTSDAAPSRARAQRWSGIFAQAPRRPAAAVAPPEPTVSAPEPDAPPLPDPAPEPAPAVEPAPPAPAPEPEPKPTEDLADLLAGTDLSAALRTAFHSRGVPA